MKHFYIILVLNPTTYTCVHFAAALIVTVLALGVLSWMIYHLGLFHWNWDFCPAQLRHLGRAKCKHIPDE